MCRTCSVWSAVSSTGRVGEVICSRRGRNTLVLTGGIVYLIPCISNPLVSHRGRGVRHYGSELPSVLFQRFSVKQPFCFWLQRTQASLQACIINTGYPYPFQLVITAGFRCVSLFGGFIMSALKRGIWILRNWSFKRYWKVFWTWVLYLCFIFIIKRIFVFTFTTVNL